MVQVLNASIYDTEGQLVYYEEQSKVVLKYCKDVSSLYDAFLYILITVFCYYFLSLSCFPFTLSILPYGITKWN